MTEFTETTAENLRTVRTEKGMNQEALAEMLGIPSNAISKIETGTRSLSVPEKAILDWHFFGTMPPRIANPTELRGVLEFSPEEWAVIGVLAKRVGQTHREWIKSSVLNIVYGSGLMGNAPLASLPPAIQSKQNGA